MSAEPITDLATAVEVMGALPMPAGPAAPKALTPAREQQIRAMEPAPPGLLGLGRAGSESEQRLYGRAVELHAACGELLAEIERLRGERDVVAKFVAKRAEYITAIENCHPNNDYDYNRWQGHAESRRQLAQQLGLPVAWPVKDEEAGR
ncbi:hypothetical protein [Streptomyces mirabilis]|uniref:hypothetical protein n=1 Tax=Streptomyces mirabilis TaxID=68239 RepID=UPI0033FB5BE4